MNKIEYKIVRDILSPELLIELNKQGQEGWKCFEIKKVADEYKGEIYELYFQREIEEINYTTVSAVEVRDEIEYNPSIISTYTIEEKE